MRRNNTKDPARHAQVTREALLHECRLNLEKYDAGKWTLEKATQNIIEQADTCAIDLQIISRTQ